ncbi:hypothetical protein ECANGB1_217 [Enterospora canceri]|uniref:Uncharacterized protein n=1 Tax=Enterospora canceri TaxID=1081671 RepID=A0A1Y1S5P2_9MICR|nr:hypothetical protein ECANGB1_217 [Enterospora canceri]
MRQMCLVLTWLFQIQCAEEAALHTIMAEYDKLEEIKTIIPAKKYRDNVILFPDVTWDNDKIGIVSTLINTVSNAIITNDWSKKDDNLRDDIPKKIINMVTSCKKEEEPNKKNIVNFYTIDNTTEGDLKAATEQLDNAVKQSSVRDDLMDCFMFEELRRATIKIGKDCNLTADEKQKMLMDHFLKLPYFMSFTMKNRLTSGTVYVYVVFAIGSKSMKSEIIKITKELEEEQIIHDLEEYKAKTSKKKTETQTTKTVPKKATEKSPKKQTEKSKVIKIALIVVGIIVGIVIIATISLILVRRMRKRSIERSDKP